MKAQSAHESMEIAPDPRMDAVFEMIFGQLIGTFRPTSFVELMNKLPEKYRKFCEPHHEQFLSDGKFV